ncbi:hypothetical protein CKAN_01105800 [Cinnamomum micranthum f. kanehirae]|uniref:Uncharacterized protein n=1 Tax=Cinnamomum micranthum f. kanehirae TaxID=337451 RepID=A0A3S3MEX2_9MAGN|nr:hypothetical protein CKAN_01105800 [Cinnamomum micranthum f. kanehirae]
MPFDGFSRQFIHPLKHSRIQAIYPGPIYALKDVKGSPNGPPVTATKVRLRDGRHLAYNESGVPKEKAKYKVVVLHGMGDSREFIIPAS